MNKHGKLFVTLSLAALPATTLAAPTIAEVLDASGITASGHVSASYVDGFNKGQTMNYRFSETDSNSFYFNQAWLDIARAPTEGAGGAVTLLLGHDAKFINAAYGDSSDTFDLAQAYLSYAKGDFTIIGGRYFTLAGAEVANDSLDTNVSRSLLFVNAEPYVHTGVRASYKIGSTVTTYLGVSNSVYSSFDNTGKAPETTPGGSGSIPGNSYDNNKMKTLETGALYAPSKAVSVGVYDYFGYEDNGPANKANYLDAVGTWQATEKLQLILNGDWYRKVSVNPALNQVAAGVAGYANYKFNDDWTGSLRAEYLGTRSLVVNCPNTSCTSNLSEATVTMAYTGVKNLAVLGEVRFDFSGDKVYSDPGTAADPNFAKQQGNLAVKAIYSFGGTSS